MCSIWPGILYKMFFVFGELAVTSSSQRVVEGLGGVLVGDGGYLQGE